MDYNNVKAIIFDPEHLSLIFSDKWQDLLKGKIKLLEHLEIVFNEKSFQALHVSPKKYVEYWLNKDNHVNKVLLKIIKELTIPCYIGTNQEKIRTLHVINSIGSYFKSCFASYKIGSIKPEIEFFKYIENSLFLHANELLLVDDSTENIIGAKKCGWNTYHYKNIDEFKIMITKLE
ncbi:MAG: HAD-IA family hydrolase [Gammaproteobacteria bacterium]